MLNLSVYLNAKRSCFWKPFRTKQVNESQKLPKSAEKQFHPTFSSFLSILKKKKKNEP